MEELGRGAEAIITRTAEGIEKNRPSKGYRHPGIDAALRKQRTRKEAKVLRDLEALGVPAPRLIRADERAGLILMTEVEGPKLRDVLEEDPSRCEQVGRLVARLHEADIIHGDLTTSNMILGAQGVIALIDFGLTYHSTRTEDRAVDLHLFRQALQSKHHEVAAEAWNAFLEGYRPADREEVLARLEVVEQRGRNKK